VGPRAARAHAPLARPHGAVWHLHLAPITRPRISAGRDRTPSGTGRRPATGMRLGLRTAHGREVAVGYSTHRAFSRSSRAGLLTRDRPGGRGGGLVPDSCQIGCRATATDAGRRVRSNPHRPRSDAVYPGRRARQVPVEDQQVSWRVAPIALDKPQRPSRVSVVRGQVGALGPGGPMRNLGVPVQNPCTRGAARAADLRASRRSPPSVRTHRRPCVVRRPGGCPHVLIAVVAARRRWSASGPLPPSRRPKPEPDQRRSDEGRLARDLAVRPRCIRDRRGEPGNLRRRGSRGPPSPAARWPRG
jgi:hypothetical protein